MVLYYNLMGPPSYMLSVVDRNVAMRRIPYSVDMQNSNTRWHPRGSPTETFCQSDIHSDPNIAAPSITARGIIRCYSVYLLTVGLYRPPKTVALYRGSTARNSWKDFGDLGDFTTKASSRL